MDYMDIDEVVDVPDTPDRLVAQHKNNRVFAGNRSSPSVICSHENIDASDDAARHGLRNKIILGKQSKRLGFCPPKSSSPLETSESHNNSGVCDLLDNSSSSKSSHLFRRMGVEKRASHEARHFISSKHLEKGKALCSNQSSSCVKNNAVVDLTEPNGHAQELRKDSRNEALKFPHQDVRKGVLSTNGFSSLSGVKNPSATNSLCKGKEKIDDTLKVVTDSKRETKVELVDSQLNVPKSVSTSLHTSASRRFPSQKRLVRNGCISPHNIAKAIQLAENHDNDSADVAQNDARTVESVSETIIKDLIEEDKDSCLVKGKMVIKNPLLSKDTDSKSRHLFSRSFRNHAEKVNTTTDASKDVLPHFDELDGWRSTHNCSFRMLEKGLNHSRRKNDFQFFNQQEQGTVRRENGSGELNAGNYPRQQEPVSHKADSHFFQVNELHNAADTLAKRQKYCLALGDCGQCSTSAIDNSDVFFGSSGEPRNATSTENQSNTGLSNLDSVIEIDEFSPQIRHGGSHVVNSSTNDESDDRARQVEADAMLARELQEQLYSESPGFGGDEFDEHIALTLQQEEESQESFSAGGRSVFHPRGSLVSNVGSRNVSIRRGSRARLARRMEQLRSHFRGQSPGASSRERIGVSYRERSSLFHPNVDADTRLHMLEALEAVSDMGMANQILQVQRDFNENDYEMLLALDENNHHLGASVRQINGLPESTIQTENLEESCAICLETPTIGDKIRHLPCLHKFHKDCIDPWLRRKTSCPVCKSSIT